MNEIAKQPVKQLPALALSEAEMMGVLRNSLYVGAKDASIKMVIGYCAAAGLDVMQKPVHLVPMWDSKSGEMRDVVMPGIGLYRTQASRSGEYAGVTEPEFGPDVTENIGGVNITYPTSCRVIVKRLLPNGSIAEFAATERWKENYAMKGGKEKSIAPNAMWIKRPYAQLAKCTEAQALRKAFPELGAMPTSDEMAGKAIDEETIIDGTSGEVIGKHRSYSQTSAESALPEGYEQYEADVLPLLKEAANEGIDALMVAFNKLEASPLKTALWINHGDAVKKFTQGEKK